MLNAFLFTFLCFLLTCLGAGVVFVIKKPNNKLMAFLHSFSAGVMLSSSVFSLIIPSIEYCNILNLPDWLILSACFILAYLMFYFLDKIPYRNSNNKIDTKMLATSIALHNIPEGMCVGFAFASASVFNTNSAFMSAVMIAIGIGIQNTPEGSSLSFPLYANGHTKIKSFLISSLVGFVEVPAGVIAYVLGLSSIGVLPYMLAFAAAVMFCVACLDLLPEAVSLNKKMATFGIFIGFIIMMMLDLALG